MICARIDQKVKLKEVQPEVNRLTSSSWLPHVNQRDYQGEWDVLPLRALTCHENAHPILQSFAIDQGEEWRDLPILNQCPYLKNWLATLLCPLKSVRLMRLKAGARIMPHRDRQLEWEQGEARLHLPIFTNTRVNFVVNGEVIPMRPGQLWYINANLTHEVANLGNNDRIHLVMDCEVNDWLEKRTQMHQF